MNRNRVFYIYQEQSNIDTTIKSLSRSNTNTNSNSTTKYYEKAKTYLATKAQQFIKFHNKSLDIKEYELYTLPYLPRFLFLVVLTHTNTNHPYGVLVHLDANYLYFVIPFGKDRKQADLEDYEFAITNGTAPEQAMLYILLEKTILIRKKAILTPGQFTLLDCNNITGCIKKKQEIGKMKISYQEKLGLMNKYNDYYLNKAIDVLKKYFDLLDVQDWDEASQYLKGKDTKYFGKERVNTFFKNTKKIIGHLEIFIPIYELFYYSRDSLSQSLASSR